MTCTTMFSFPFHCLNDTEFLQFIYDVDISNSSLDLQQVLQLRNLNSPIDCDFESDSTADNYQNLNKSKFITMEEISQLKFFPESLSILQINCRSLSTNFEHLKNLLSNFNNKPLLISLSETWLKPSDEPSLFALNGYNFVSTPRKHKRGGGTGIFISNALSYIVRDDLVRIPEDLCEYSVIEIINQHSANVIIISLYRPPDTDLSMFDTKLSKFLHHLTNNVNKKKIILSADWNIDFLKVNTNTKIDHF